jgi:hypothetical protein
MKVFMEGIHDLKKFPRAFMGIYEAELDTRTRTAIFGFAELKKA